MSLPSKYVSIVINSDSTMLEVKVLGIAKSVTKCTRVRNTAVQYEKSVK